MSASIKQAVNQVRLTNVAYVRLQRKGKKFEIACYRNKVVNWRARIESNIEEVLQIGTVFTNVSKGMLASSKDLMDAFGTTDHLAVCKEILDKGDVQVSEQERGVVLENLFRDVASIVVEKSINPENNRPYTISIIQNAMRQIHFSVNTSRSAKSQALDVIRRLKDVMPIARASMLLRVVCASEVGDDVRELLSKEPGLSFVSTGGKADEVSSSSAPVNSAPVVSLSDAYSSVGANAKIGTADDDAFIAGDAPISGTTTGPLALARSETTIDLLADPEVYRRIEELMAKQFETLCRVEVLQLRVASAAATGPTSSSTSSRAPKAQKQSALASTSTSLTTELIGGTAEADGSDNEDIVEGANDLHIAGSIGDDVEQNSEEDDDESELPPDTVFGIADKTSRKKLKKQKLKKVAAEQVTKPQELRVPASDDEDESDPDESAPSVAASTISKASASTEGPKKEASKKGKKSKRIEKEMKMERELKALKLKERLASEATSRPPVPSSVGIPGPAPGGISSSVQISSPPAPAGSTTGSTIPSSEGTAKRCNTCTGMFPDLQSYRNHFRSEWHNHNLKRKMKNLPIIESEEAFANLTYEELEI